MNLGTFSLDNNAKKINLNFQVKISFNPNEDLSAENLKVEVLNSTAENKEKKKSKSKSKGKPKHTVFTNMSQDEEETASSLNASSKLQWTDTPYPVTSKSIEKISSSLSAEAYSMQSNYNDSDSESPIEKVDVSQKKLSRRNDLSLQFNQNNEPDPYSYELNFNENDEPDLEQLSRHLKHYNEYEEECEKKYRLLDEYSNENDEKKEGE